MHLLSSILVFIAFLTGCSSTEPEVEKQTKVTFSLFSDSSSNPNSEGVSSPVEIKVFELEDDSMLLSSDYHQMESDYEEALKSNYVKSYDYVLTPSQFKFVDMIEVDKRTNYIGVIAHFSEPEVADWKKAVKIQNRNQLYHLFIYFRDYEIILKRVE